ncbi:MAG: ABC transporter permease [Ruminiclostridium sp.]
MMFPTNNKSVIKKLTKRTMKANRIRNIFVITAIALTTFLLTTIFSIGMSMIDSIELQQLRIMGTTAHAALTHPTFEQIKKLKELDYIKDVGLQANAGDIIETLEMGNMILALHWFNQSEWENFRKPAMSDIVGTYPTKYNEIMIPTWILNRMGVDEPKIGMEIEIKYRVTKNNITSDIRNQKFILSSYYTEYMNIRSDNLGIMLVSNEFIEKSGMSPEISGASSVIFKSPSSIASQVNRIAGDIKISDDQNLKIVPIYDSGSVADTSTMLGLAGVILVIMLSSYLLIYNVLALSVSKDIRFYGLLRRIVMGQALRLTLIGIPIGLLLGAAISFVAVPLVINITSIETGIRVSFSPIIYIGAIVFTMLTMLIGSIKPAKKAGSISPIEAVCFTGLSNKRKHRESGHGGKIHKMALRNIFRDRKRAVLVLVSLFLGMTTFLVINTLVLSMNIDNLVDDYIQTDFKLTNNISNIRDSGIKQKFDNNFLSELKSIKSITNEREILRQEVTVRYDEELYGKHWSYLAQKYKIPLYSKDEMLGNPDLFWSCLIGVDTDYIKELNKKMDKPIDLEAFEKGEIALFSTDTPELYQLGSNITCTNKDNNSKTTIKLGGFLRGDTPYKGVSGLAPDIYVSNTKMHQLYNNPIVYAITLDAEDEYEAKLLLQLKEMIGMDNEISLDSRQQRLDQFNEAKLIMFILGGGMSLILALIGIVNFINVIVTSINVRRQEFAILESIGMTSRQLKKMLLLEGWAYALISCVSVLVFGNCISYGLFTLFRTEATYAVYTFPILPLSFSFFVIFAICLIVPNVTYQSICRQSVTERLRSIEG